MKNKVIVPTIITLTTMLISSCSGNMDQTIKADLSVKATTEKDFEGVWFTVENSVVNLNGECSTQKAKDAVETKVKKLYGVKSVVNNIAIAPVVIGTDRLLKQGVDSILQQYATVAAVTRDSIVYLQGSLPGNELQPLTDAVNSLKPKTVENKLVIK